MPLVHKIHAINRKKNKEIIFYAFLVHLSEDSSSKIEIINSCEFKRGSDIFRKKNEIKIVREKYIISI